MSDDDPDETDGRKLYRASANNLARAQIAMASRQVQMTDQPKRDTPRPGQSDVKLPIPSELDAIARTVLSYKPKPKSKPAKARKRRAAKIGKEK